MGRFGAGQLEASVYRATGNLSHRFRMYAAERSSVVLERMTGPWSGSGSGQAISRRQGRANVSP